MKRSINEAFGQSGNEVEVISLISPSPESPLICENEESTLSTYSSQQSAVTPGTRPLTNDHNFVGGVHAFRPRSQTFRPATYFQIPSVRMGPPYPGIRNQMIFDVLPLPARPLIPIAYRNRLFSPGTDVPSSLIKTIINLDDSSGSSVASGNSSDEAITEEETDLASTCSSTVDKKKELPIVVKLEQKVDVKAAMSIGQSRVVEPITIDDSDESPPGTPKPSVRKAKLTASSQKDKSPGKSPSVGKLIGLLPESDSDDDMTEILQFGMSMIKPEELIKTISNVLEKPKRLYLKRLYSHVKHGLIGKVFAFLKGGANPAAVLRNEEGKTSLHMAASKGHLEILLMLVYKAGLQKIDVYDNQNRTPLFMAVERKQFHAAQFLVNAGADFTIKNSEGINLLHVAARKGTLHFIKWLVRLGICVNEQDKYGWTALMWAAEGDSNAEVLKYLIKKGALTNLIDNEMNICLHWSAIAGSFECTKILVSHSLDPHVNAKNKFGETPLHVAAKGDHFHVTQYLLLNGADHKIKNNSNLTPLDVCPAGSKTFHCIRIRNEVGEPKVDHYKYISDISHGKERNPVSCINEVDNEAFPCDFVYITKPEESSHVSVKRGLSTVRPCKCVGSCNIDCKCIRLSENGRLWYSDDGRLDISIFEEESPVLYECTPLCSCWSHCPNRLVQKGVQYSLQVFKTKDKGWGLRTLTAIPTGAFILPYVGELITDEEAERRSEDTYLFNLDLKTSGDEPNCMDALRYGNCGRFINHSCDANMRAVKLFTSQRDVSFPEVAFFAYKDIQAREELSFNYGDSFWDVKLAIGMYCKCASDTCQYAHPT